MAPAVELTRRAFLETLSAGTASRFLRRPAIPVHVGYAERTGRRAAMSLARTTTSDHAFEAVTIRADRATIRRLLKRDDVRYVEPVRPVFSLSKPIDDGVDRVDADVAFEKDARGTGADVGVIDSGIDKGHGALGDNLAGGKPIVRAGFFHFTPWDDDYGHGTHCAGLIGGSGPYGVCTDASLHAVKVLNGSGQGTTEDLVAGIEHVAEKGWDVANLSLGTAKSKAVADACAYAAEKGVALVAAAAPEKRGYPARYDECIAVGALGEDGVLEESPTDGSVDLLAPGASIRSSVPGGYARRSGTSAACAYVSGAAAHLAAKGFTREGIRSRLTDTAESLSLSAKAQGAGLLDVAAALGYDSEDD